MYGIARPPLAVRVCPKLVVLTMTGMLLFAVSQVAAQAPADLVKTANSLLRDSQRKMFSGKNDAAIEQLLKAAKAIQSVEKAEPGNSSLRTLKSKAEKLRKDLERKTKKTINLEAGTVGESDTPKPADKPTPKPKSDGEKLPSAVTSRLVQIDRPLRWAEKMITDDASVASPESRSKKAEYYLKQARDVMGEIQKRYGGKIPDGHPEMEAAERKIARVEKLVQDFSSQVSIQMEAEAKALVRRKADSEAWLAKLNPYILGRGRVGHVPDKYLVPAGTADVEELNQRKRIYDEARSTLAEYEKTEFPAGKTDELQRAEEELRRSLTSFEEGFAESQGNLLQLAVKRVDETLAFLQRKQEWRQSKSKKPYVLAKQRLDDIEKLIARAAKAAPDSAQLGALRQKMGALSKENDERQRVRTARTFLTEDKYKAADLKELKKAADTAVAKKVSAVKVLRTTVISSDWKEERVLESTDTTNTALRYRVTRRLVSQVAGKSAEGVFLYTVNIEKDRQSDGSWGPLKSHVMFIDAMLQTNVHKKPPEGS